MAGGTVVAVEGIRHPGRVAIVTGGIAIVVLLLAVAIGTADTRDARNPQPDQVKVISPKRGAIVPPQEQISVDLRDDLTADLSVCNPSPQTCTPIPADQVSFIPALGQLTFRPGEGKEIDRYSPGLVQVRVDYRSQADPDKDRGTFSWSFVSKS